MFPSMTGVSLTYHIPYDVGQSTRAYVKEFASLNEPRVKATLRTLSDRLKTAGERPRRFELQTFFDQSRREMEDSLHDR